MDDMERRLRREIAGGAGLETVRQLAEMLETAALPPRRPSPDEVLEILSKHSVELMGLLGLDPRDSSLSLPVAGPARVKASVRAGRARALPGVVVFTLRGRRLAIQVDAVEDYEPVGLQQA